MKIDTNSIAQAEELLKNLNPRVKPVFKDQEDYDRQMKTKAQEFLPNFDDDLSQNEFLENLVTVNKKTGSLAERKAAAAALQQKAYLIRTKQLAPPPLTLAEIEATRKMLEEIQRPKSFWGRIFNHIRKYFNLQS